MSCSQPRFRYGLSQVFFLILLIASSTNSLSVFIAYVINTMGLKY